MVARTSILFYVAAFMVFMSVAVLPFFVMQRGLFVKERCNGTYGVSLLPTSLPCAKQLRVSSPIPPVLNFAERVSRMRAIIQQ